jgi:hypothetical protein
VKFLDETAGGVRAAGRAQQYTDSVTLLIEVVADIL